MTSQVRMQVESRAQRRAGAYASMRLLLALVFALCTLAHLPTTSAAPLASEQISSGLVFRQEPPRWLQFSRPHEKVSHQGKDHLDWKNTSPSPFTSSEPSRRVKRDEMWEQYIEGDEIDGEKSEDVRAGDPDVAGDEVLTDTEIAGGADEAGEGSTGEKWWQARRRLRERRSATTRVVP
ncbi:hypothetical protein MVLG_02245 [Microbotryum lychnidis-dioicae p1A1 Lamole]|uniref:Transmembrane protein n=1 Tax=Microbotryum lychnidis-dioicae (strain p1A1 Lamole / MvSl-1064) TaxID=683840 RepID=U5H4K7_USTV1|nr:hypothetical protein MVLG_02245 [Microbotryum lychnidis-dioicae p1A1 Lamole]|eukprot:KDE07576.1 hypothetical protein MVLG_02245 [Microbotryum lychnidis-dioicae p1A1 Lamole]